MTAKEDKERDRGRRDRLANYFFNLPQLTFAALVLGGFTPLLGREEADTNWYTLVAGVVAAIVFASYANRILKTK